MTGCLRRCLLSFLLFLVAAHAHPVRADQYSELQRILALLGFDAIAATAPVNARVWADALAQQHQLSVTRQQQLLGHLRGWPDAQAIRKALLLRVAPLCSAAQIATALQRLEHGGLASLQVALALDGSNRALELAPGAAAPRADIDALLEAAGTVEQLLVMNTMHEQLLGALLEDVWQIGASDYGAANAHVRAASVAVQRSALHELARTHYQKALRYTGDEQIRSATAALQDEAVRCVLDNATAQLAFTLQGFAQSP